MDQSEFVTADWWLKHSDLRFDVVGARSELGQNHGWDQYWYQDADDLTVLYNTLQAKNPQLLSEVTMLSDEGQLAWLRDAGGYELVLLSPQQRQRLERLTGDRLQASYTTLEGATGDIEVSHLRASLHKSPDLLVTIFQIAIGLAIPPLGKAISELAESIPPDASTTAYRVALRLADEDKTTEALQKAYEKGKSYFESTAAQAEVKEANSEQAVLDKIRDTYHQGIDQIDSSLSDMSDEDLGLVYVAHDPGRMTHQHFREEVEKLLGEYAREVDAQGGLVQEDVTSGIRQVVALRYIDRDEAGTDSFLATVDVGRGGIYFDEVVADEVVEDAINRWKATEDGQRNGEVIPHVAVSRVADVPDALKAPRQPERVSIFAKKRP